MNAIEKVGLFNKYMAYVIENMFDEYDFASIYFLDIDNSEDIPDYSSEQIVADQIDRAFDSLRHASSEGYEQTYDYYDALRFFDLWIDSREMMTVWENCDWVDIGDCDSPQSLLTAAVHEYDETSGYDERPLCGAICEFNRYLINQIFDALVWKWDRMVSEMQ